jgi:predicted ester cyclase
MQRCPMLLSAIIGLFLVVAVSVQPRAIAQEATPAACPTTTEEENVALITQLHEALDAGEDASSLFGAEHVIHVATGEDITNNSPTWLSDRLADYPDLTLTEDLAVAQDDLVAVYVTWSGTQEGADETMGVPATGQKAEWASTVIFRIECGKIVELWPVTDTLGLLMDLGVITEEELQNAEGMATPTS